MNIAHERIILTSETKTLTTHIVLTPCLYRKEKIPMPVLDIDFKLHIKYYNIPPSFILNLTLLPVIKLKNRR